MLDAGRRERSEGASREERRTDFHQGDAMQEIRIQSLGREDSLEKGMATHSSILAWRFPRTEEHGGLQSMGSQRVEHN